MCLGIIFFGVGIGLWFGLGYLLETIPMTPDDEWLVPFRYLMSLGFGVPGALITVFSIPSTWRGLALRRLKPKILSEGSQATATITFLDRNYSFLVNNRPVYSIIEYRYTDLYGQPYTQTITNASTETVIRMDLSVGSEIPIRYLPDDPAKSLIVWDQIQPEWAT